MPLHPVPVLYCRDGSLRFRIRVPVQFDIYFFQKINPPWGARPFFYSPSGRYVPRSDNPVPETQLLMPVPWNVRKPRCSQSFLFLLPAFPPARKEADGYVSIPALLLFFQNVWSIQGTFCFFAYSQHPFRHFTVFRFRQILFAEDQPPGL